MLKKSFLKQGAEVCKALFGAAPLLPNDICSNYTFSNNARSVLIFAPVCYCFFINFVEVVKN